MSDRDRSDGGLTSSGRDGSALDELERRLIEAKLAASEADQDLIAYIIDMALSAVEDQRQRR